MNNRIMQFYSATAFSQDANARIRHIELFRVGIGGVGTFLIESWAEYWQIGS